MSLSRPLKAERPLCLLSLDGGGVRGLSELVILDELMQKIEQAKGLSETPRPCEIFDMICGTSTGGIIALMLGRLRMTTKEAIDVYCDLSHEVFTKNSSLFSENMFSAAVLERLLKATIARYGQPKDDNGKADPEMLLFESPSQSHDEIDECKVFVVSQNVRAMGSPRLFKSYRHYSAGAIEKMTIWQAARATSAAPTFFERLEIGTKHVKDSFIDGGLGHNNPTQIMLSEAKSVFGDRPIGCVVSIGTGEMNPAEFSKPQGLQKIIPVELIDAMTKMTTDCQKVALEVKEHFQQNLNVYYRLNVNIGLQDIKLEDKGELANIRAKTQQYLDRKARRVAGAVSAICKSARVISALGLAPQHIRQSINNASDIHARNKCLNSLAFPEMDDRFNSIKDGAEGTNQWLFQDVRFREWADMGPTSNHRKQHLLWIKGNPGVGKSTLVRAALEHVKTNREGKDDLFLSFFFHGRGNELQKSPLGLFRALLHQMLSQPPNHPKELSSDYRKWYETTNKEKLWQLPELERYFIRPIPRILEARELWLFVDAIDECGEKDAVTIINFLQEISRKNSRLRLLFTCRHYPKLGGSAERQIWLQQEAGHNEDIKNYVCRQLNDSPDLAESKIPDIISKRAGGTFMWACLVVAHVLQLDRPSVGLERIELAILKLPAELSQLYEDIFLGLTDKRLSWRLFSWVCCATEPMALEAMRWALVIEYHPPGYPTYRSIEYYENILRQHFRPERFEGRVKALSCGLAEVVQSKDVKIVQVIHQSVKEFVFDRGLQILYDGYVRPNFVGLAPLARANWEMSRICLNFIGLGANILEKNRDTPAWHKYFFNSWILHAQFSESLGEPQADLVKHFDWPKSPTLLRTWIRSRPLIRDFDLQDYWLDCATHLLNVRGWFWAPRRSHDDYNAICHFDYESLEKEHMECTLFHIVAHYGLVSPLREMLRLAEHHDFNVNAMDALKRTALSYAAMNERQEVVQSLLDRNDVDPDSKDSWGRTPISYAAEVGHLEIVKLLLNQDKVDPDSKDYWRRTPMSHAASNGHLKVVELLHNRDEVDPDSKDYWLRTPMSHAAQNGYLEVVKLLLDRDEVDPDSKDYFRRTPLSYAAQNGYLQVAKLLLDRDEVDPGSKNNSARTPRSYAAQNGHIEVVELLLQKDSVKPLELMFYAGQNRQLENMELD